MNKTSINDLYPDVDNFRTMDIVTIRNMLDNETREVKLNLRSNLRKVKKQEIELMKAYDKIYDLCIEKINEAINFKKTDTIFKIPHIWKDFSNYSMSDCANHIINKLKKEQIICMKIADSLFITWDHIK